jgi:pilus assembly protein CpaC
LISAQHQSAMICSPLLRGALFCGALFCGVLRAQMPPGTATGVSTSTPSTTPAMADSHFAHSSSAMTSRIDIQSKTLHLLIGGSAEIFTTTRLKRVYISSPVVIDSFTASPTEIIVTAKSTGVSGLILWNEDGHSQIYQVSVDANTSQLQNDIRQALPNDSIKVSALEDRITLTGTALSANSSTVAATIAALYGKTVVNAILVRPPHPRQVSIKVQMVEVDRTKLDTFGINFLSQGKNMASSGTGQFPAVTATTSTAATGAANVPTLTVSSALNLLYYNSGVNIGMILQDLENRQVAQILAEPTITTVSGQKASFLSGGEFPFPIVQASSGGLASITIQFRPYGVKLEVTPIVNADGTILLTVAPEVSALDFSNAVTISGYTIPAISTRKAETQVELRSGQTFAISGLLDHRTIDIYNKMPGVGDVPVLGKLFRSKSTTKSAVELVVLVTPTVLDPLIDNGVPKLPNFPVPLLDEKQFDKTLPKEKPPTQTQPATGKKR